MKKILKYFISFFSSINLTIVLLAVLAVFFTAQAANKPLLALFKSWTWLSAIAKVDIYHSWWFIFLLVLFCLNLVACCINRLPKTLAFIKVPAGEPGDGMMDELPVVKRFTIKEGIASGEKLRTLLSSHFRKIKTVGQGERHLYLFAEKGKYAHLGFYFAHLSILFMVLGVMLSTRGYEYSFEMREGQILDPLVVRDDRGERKVFDFSLLCEDSETIYYQDRSEVMKHQSTLAILRDGEKVKTQLVDFSRPLVYSGIDIYQDRFSRIIRYAKVKVVSKSGEVQVHEVKSGGRFKLSDSGIVITAWKIKSRTNAVQLKSSLSSSKLSVSNTPVSFFDKRLRDYQFSLVEIFKKESTSLKIIKDPGKGVIWYSFLIMVLGFSITFFFFHQKVWAKVEEKGGECIITLAGSANKNLRAIEEIFNSIQSELSEEKL